MIGAAARVGRGDADAARTGRASRSPTPPPRRAPPGCRSTSRSGARSRRAPSPERLRARSRAAPTNSRKSGAGRVGRDLNSGWNWLATNHGWSGSSTISTRRPPWNVPDDDEPVLDEPRPDRVVDLVAVPVPLVRRPRRRRPRAPACPPSSSTACAPRRIVPPRSSTSFCSGSRSITGYGVSGSISVELAPSSPTTCRANSETATCMPRQMPRYGIAVLARDAAGEDLPLPAARAEAARDEHAVDLLELAPRPRRATSPRRRPSARRTCAPWWMPACLSASCTERYASWSFTYLPTSAISTHPVALGDPLRQLEPLAEVGRPARRARACGRRASSSPCSCSACGTR